jgi:hypothetical protein
MEKHLKVQNTAGKRQIALEKSKIGLNSTSIEPKKLGEKPTTSLQPVAYAESKKQPASLPSRRR